MNKDVVIIFSYEIQDILQKNNYRIDSDSYEQICSSSPQISRIKYSPYGDYFEIWTKDEYYWKINVYRK